VTRWLGKMRLLRVALGLWAAALCAAIWPALVGEALPRHPFQGFPDFGYEWYSAFGNPVFLEGNGIEAWDWRTGERWRLPTFKYAYVSLNCVISEGHTRALTAMVPGEGILLIDVAPPHQTRICPWSSTSGQVELVTVDPQLKFAVLVLHQEETNVQVVELATGKVVDGRTRVERVYALGSGEIALLQASVDLSPNATSVAMPTCWKVAENGQLEQIATAPVIIEAEALAKSTSPEDTVVSPDGRYQAAQAYPSSMVVRDRVNGRVLDKLPVSDWQLGRIAFSADSKCLLAGGYYDSFQVYDLETEALVADDHRTEHRWRTSNILMAASVTPLILALLLAIRMPSFERMACDYVLATLFLDSLATAIALHDRMLPRGGAIYGAIMAIGVYWAIGPQALWKRLAYGTLGIAMLFCAQMNIVSWVVIVEVVGRDAPSTFLSDLSLATLCAVFAWLMTVPFGWRISGDESFHGAPRFQFGIGTICLVIAVAAVFLAMVGRLLEVSALPFLRGSVVEIALVSLIFVVAVLVFMSIVWLMLWIWFRRSIPYSLLVGLTSAAWILVLAASVTKTLTTSWIRPQAHVTLTSWGALFVQFAWFGLALCFARQHGYRWVKASKPEPTPKDPAGAAA
jgi:hypothetical protein